MENSAPTRKNPLGVNRVGVEHILATTYHPSPSGPRPPVIAQTCTVLRIKLVELLIKPSPLLQNQSEHTSTKFEPNLSSWTQSNQFPVSSLVSNHLPALLTAPDSIFYMKKTRWVSHLARHRPTKRKQKPLLIPGPDRIWFILIIFNTPDITSSWPLWIGNCRQQGKPHFTCSAWFLCASVSDIYAPAFDAAPLTTSPSNLFWTLLSPTCSYSKYHANDAKELPITTS